MPLQLQVVHQVPRGQPPLQPGELLILVTCPHGCHGGDSIEIEVRCRVAMGFLFCYSVRKSNKAFAFARFMCIYILNTSCR